jgi:hypothetical protein
MIGASCLLSLCSALHFIGATHDFRKVLSIMESMFALFQNFSYVPKVNIPVSAHPYRKRGTLPLSAILNNSLNHYNFLNFWFFIPNNYCSDLSKLLIEIRYCKNWGEV